MNILIYGVISRRHQTVGEEDARGWKMHLKSYADRLLWRFGSTTRLDYRNYDAPYPTNSGDIAIVEAVRKQIQTRLNNATFTNVNWGELETLDKRVLDECDHIVVAGSGYFFLSADGLLAQRVVADLAAFERTAKPLTLYGIGINRPFGGSAGGDTSIAPDDAAFLRRFLERTAYIGVRDHASQEMLARYTDKPVALIGDPALFLDPASHSLNARATQPVANQPPRIGVNFSFHGPLSTRILKQNLPAYVDLLHTLQEETGGSLHYFVHSHSEWIIPILLGDSGLGIETIRGEPTYLAQRYAEMNVHLGGMLHSCILAVGAGTPCALLPYDIKHRHFAELVGLEDHCHDATQLNPPAVLNSLRYLLANEEAVRDSLRQHLNALRQKQEQFLRTCLPLPATVDHPGSLPPKVGAGETAK